MKKLMLLAAIAPAFGYAQETSQEQTMVVTASRMQQPANSVIAPLTLVTREQIENSGAQDIVDVLSQQVGISVTRNGGIGQTESVFIRGSHSAQTLYLIDGVRVNTATNGGAQLSLLPLEFVERIEILRGARASIYGADAVGGVINIITRPEFGQQFLGLKAALGTEDSAQFAARASGLVMENTQYNVVLNANRSDGYDIRPQDTLNEDYGYESLGGLFSIEHRFNEAWRASIFTIYNEGEAEYIQGTKYLNKQKQAVYGAKLNYHAQQWTSELALNYQQDRSDSADATNFVNPDRYTTERQAFNWLLAYQLNKQWLLQGGVDLQNEDISGSSVAYQQQDRDNNAVYVNARADYIKHVLEASLRHDDNQHYGEHSTYNVGWSWQLQSDLRFHALHGTAYRAPTFNDLYYPGSENPNLKAETSTNTEFGFALDLLRAQWQFNVFHNDIENLIAWGCVANCDNDYSGAPDSWPLWTPDNVNDARIQGIEVQGDFSTAWLNHRIILELLDAEDKASGKQLIRRPQEQIKYKADVNWQQLNVVLDILWRGESYENAANTQVLDSYAVWDLSANYRFANGFRLDAKLRNLFDKDYSTAATYQAQGRSFELGASYQF